MSRNNSTECKRRVQFGKVSFWVLVVGLIFAVSSLIANEDDTSSESDTVVDTADENEKSVSDETNGKEKTKTDSLRKDETTSEGTDDKETSLEQLIAKAKEVKSDRNSNDGVTKNKAELGSYLPNGDPSSIVTVITHEESISKLMDEIERLARFR